MMWFDVASLSSEDKTLEALFNDFKDCLVKVCDENRLNIDALVYREAA